MDNPLLNPTPISNMNVPKPALLSKILNRIKTHKKIAVASIIVLLVILTFLFGSLALKDRLFPNVKLPSPFQQSNANKLDLVSMQLKTPKTNFSQSEKIPVVVEASSNNSPITGFDVVVGYDPQFLTFSDKKKPPLDNFIYYGKNNNSLVQVSAVLKPDSNSPQKFNKTSLVELEFTPKKIGKTSLKIIYMPNLTSESNLLNNESKDILGSVRGVEITIN